MSELQELVLFNAACDEFISGKYILADIKISKILTVKASLFIPLKKSSNCETKKTSKFVKFISPHLYRFYNITSF